MSYSPEDLQKVKSQGLITIKHSQVKDDLARGRANKLVEQAGKDLGSSNPGYTYTGSAVVHFYFSDLVGPSFMIQTHLGETREYVANLGATELLLKMMEAYGHQRPRKRMHNIIEEDLP